jgi:hypothetical protein
VESEREEREGEKLSFGTEKNDNFLDPQSVLLEPFASLNTGPTILFPSHICGVSE